MAHIFVSYSRADRQFIDQFIPLIRRVYGNDSVWFDADIHGGVDWWKMIVREIDECDLFIYLISDESLESPYCQSELRESLRSSKPVLPVIVRRLNSGYPGKVETDLVEHLKKTQYVDLSEGFQDAQRISELYAATHRLLDSSENKFVDIPQLASKRGSYRFVRHVVLLVLAIVIIGGGVLIVGQNFGNLLNTIPATGTSNQSQVRSETVILPANLRWLDTGISLTQRQEYSIEASGRIKVCTEDTCGDLYWNKWQSPDGDNEYSSCDPCIAADAPPGSLIGRVGYGKAFFIGRSGSFIANVSGNLFLAVNDQGDGHDDNVGEFTVRIAIRY